MRIQRVQRCLCLSLLAWGLALIFSCGCQAAEFQADVLEKVFTPNEKIKELIKEFPNGAVAVTRGKEFVRGDVIRGEYHNIGVVEDVKTGKTHGVPHISSRPDEIVIRSMGEGKAWMISTHCKTYCEVRFAKVKICDVFNGWKQAGEENVSGYMCKKYVRSFSMPTGTGYTMTVWWSEQLRWSIRSETSYSDGLSETRKLVNIVAKKLPDSLFIPPKGYKKQPCPKDSVVAGRFGQYP